MPALSHSLSAETTGSMFISQERGISEKTEKSEVYMQYATQHMCRIWQDMSLKAISHIIRMVNITL